MSRAAFRGVIVAGAVLSAAAVAAPVEAAVITAISANNTPTVVNSIPAGGTGDSGYYVFGMLPADATDGYKNVSLPATSGNSVSAGINGLPAWASVSFANPGNSYMHAADSLLSVSGTSYRTLANFNAVTITLGAGAPAEFTLGMLASNADDTSWDLVVSAPAVSPSSSVTIQARTYHHGVNDFYYFSVAGATPGDTIKVNSGGTAYGGFTFSAVPEPASLSLLGLGSLLMVRRYRWARDH